jgi:RAB6A-GEF complex partner protein 1
VHVVNHVAPVVHLAPSGEDSLLVYTYENRLHHYVINGSGGTVKLDLVGQIELHGIIRAPARVRALSWILPEDQLGEWRG